MKKFFKQCYYDLPLILLSSILLLFIIKKMPYAIIGCLLNFSLSITGLYFIYKKDNNLNKTISAKEFFSCLLTSLNRTFSLERSYQIASKYLLSYHELKNYDDFLNEKSFPYLNEYELYYKELIEKEINNEIHLSNYYFLTRRIEKEVESSKKYNNFLNKLSYIILSIINIIFFILVFLRFTLFTNTNYNSNFIFNCIPLLFSLIIPLIYLAKYYLKGEKI